MFIRKRSTGLAIPVLLLGAALTVAACGSGSPSGPSVVNLGNSTSSTAPSASGSSGDAFQQALAYSACMRSHGLPKFPDPQRHGNGVTLSIGKDAGLDPGSKTFQNAQKACRSLDPAGRQGGGGGHVDPTKIAAWMQCLRTHGLPNLPDPKNTGNGLEFDLPGGSGSGITPGSSTFQKAMTACKSKSPGGGIGIRAGGPPS